MIRKAILSGLLLAGCGPGAMNIDDMMIEDTSYVAVSSSGPSRNVTPYDDVFACYGDKLGRNRVSIAVGDVRDYTGKTADGEGLTITQGGALMAYTGLGKMAPGVALHERFDTRVADAELAWINARQLGNGGSNTVENAETGIEDSVPWIPYYGGSILQSDYYIVGGITELNYNIRSGGAEAMISGLGPRARTYVMNVAVDLRIVGSQSLRVYDTISIQKQIVGYEVDFEVFRFFGDDLFDINAGVKNNEPLQLGVRVAIEEGLLQLVQSVTQVSAEGCLPAPQLVEADAAG